MGLVEPPSKHRNSSIAPVSSSGKFSSKSTSGKNKNAAKKKSSKSRGKNKGDKNKGAANTTAATEEGNVNKRAGRRTSETLTAAAAKAPPPPVNLGRQETSMTDAFGNMLMR